MRVYLQKSWHVPSVYLHIKSLRIFLQLVQNKFGVFILSTGNICLNNDTKGGLFAPVEERCSLDRIKQQASINSQRILLMCVSVLSLLIMLLFSPNVYYLIQTASRYGSPVFRIKSPQVVCEGSREVCGECSPGSGRVFSPVEAVGVFLSSPALSTQTGFSFWRQGVGH